jgi:hypothetical protein
MVYRFATKRLWRTVKWLVRREFMRRSVPRPLLYAGGLAIVAAIAAFVLSRKGAPDPAELAG